MQKEDLHDYVMVEKKVFPEIVLKKLTVKDAQADFEAIQNSAELIRKLVETNWPDDNFNFKDNKIDIERHESEFREGRNYTFGVWDPTEQNYLGCVYFYREEKPWLKNIPSNCDVVVEFWVTQYAYDQGMFNKLLNSLKGWLDSKELPFKSPYFSNQK